MSDAPKTPKKFDLQKIVSDVKAMITPAAIPEASKDDPIGYHFSELNKVTHELGEISTKLADTIAKLNNIIGAAYPLVTALKKGEAKSEK